MARGTGSCASRSVPAARGAGREPVVHAHDAGDDCSHHAVYYFPASDELYVVWNGHHHLLDVAERLQRAVFDGAEPVYSGDVRMWYLDDPQGPVRMPLCRESREQGWIVQDYPAHVRAYLEAHLPPYSEEAWEAQRALRG